MSNPVFAKNMKIKMIIHYLTFTNLNILHLPPPYAWISFKLMFIRAQLFKANDIVS